MLHSYDFIFSIGSACSCTTNLRLQGLQKFSYPFDWLYGPDFHGRIEIIKNKFKNFINFESCKLIFSDRSTKYHAYKNIDNGLIFNHDFPMDEEFRVAYAEVSKKYLRRINRTLLNLETSKKTLLVYLETPNEKHIYDIYEICKAQRELSKSYCKTDIDILYIAFDENMRHGEMWQEEQDHVYHVRMNYKSLNSGDPDYAVDSTCILRVLSQFSLNFEDNDTEVKPLKPRPYVQGLVSVLIPSYNHENYIESTIRSIINQTYANIELIIVDDGSKDRSWDIITGIAEECRLRFSKLTLVRQQNAGTCNSFNRCAFLAQGEFIYFIASDDIALPEAIECEYDFLSKNPDYGLVVGENDIIDSSNNIIFWDKHQNTVRLRDDAYYISFSDMLKKTHPNVDFESSKFGTYKTLINTNYIPNGYLIRHSIFDLTGGYRQEAPLEDWYIMMQLSKYSRFKFIRKTLFQYRWHNDNTIKNREKINDFYHKTKAFEQENFQPHNKKRSSISKHGSIAFYSLLLFIYAVAGFFFKVNMKRIIRKINKHSSM